MARGEAIYVVVAPASGSDRGSLVTYATTRDPYSKGGDSCDPSADPPVTCATGETCINGACWAEPARSCREYDGNADFLRQVAKLDINVSDGPNMAIRATEPSGNTVLCFSPDGRVLKKDGSAFNTAGDERCLGETFLLYVADANATIGDTEKACGAGPDLLDPLNMYRVAVPYNGAISVSQ